MIEMMNNHLGLYIHIPFCVRKCNYCDFASISANKDLQLGYFRALMRELKIKSAVADDRQVDSVYIGGGTPTVLSADLLYELCNAVTYSFKLSEKVEFSIEINPGTANDEIINALMRTKINRVSIGVQSFVDDELKLLGRIHDKDVAIDTINKLNPLYNLNIDLIFGIPEQTVSSWKKTLLQAISLNPDHISAYSLIVEDGTKISDWLEEGRISLPNEADEDEMYITAVSMLGDAGYMQYEVSNFARENTECKHNIGYWRGDDYLGVGSSAVSYICKLRSKNCDDVCEYISKVEAGISPVIYVERNSAKIGLMEKVMLGLRMCDGFELAVIEKKWGCKIADISEKYKILLQKGVLEINNGNLKLSKENFRFANNIIVEMMREL